MIYGYAPETLLLTHYGFPYYHSKRALDFFIDRFISLLHIISHHGTAREICSTVQVRVQAQGSQTEHHVN